MTLKNVTVQVWGDMTADKAADQYPTMVLCPDCIGNYEIVAEEGSSPEDCEECGEPSREEEEEEEE